MLNPSNLKYKVNVTLQFNCTFFFPHNDLMSIKDVVTKQYHDRIRTIRKLFPMLQFTGYKYKIEEVIK